MVDILNSIWGLLLTPDTEDPAYGTRFDSSDAYSNTLIAARYYSDQDKFKDIVKRHVGKHAAKSRQELKLAIKGTAS